jgi:tyrosyl-tRNA synthetase
MTHPLLVGTDGTEKMSKSLGNTVGITEAPEEIYGKIMSISDASMVGYVKVLGFGGWKDLVPRAAQVAAGDGGDPLALKQELARRLVERFHGAEAASRAGDHFRRVIQERQVPDQVPEVALDLGPEGERGLLEVLRLALDLASTGEARRLVVQGAVRIDGEPVREPTLRLGAGSYLLKAGKRRFARVRLS